MKRDIACVRSESECRECVERLTATGIGSLLGGDYVWPVALMVGEFRKADAPPGTAELEKDYRGRLDFLLEKCRDERGISAPKAWGQVQMFRWLFGWDDEIDEDFPGFTAGAVQAQEWLKELD